MHYLYLFVNTLKKNNDMPKKNYFLVEVTFPFFLRPARCSVVDGVEEESAEFLRVVGMNTPRSAKVFCRNRDVLLSLSLSLLLRKAVCKEGMRGSSIPSKGWWDDDDGCCHGEVWWGQSLDVGGCERVADDE
ncbi:hypothetical protein BDC45DRAFT_530258 [Circinella umbellata]|nr:hypothetical protein BDC45DRAFT_530258 [Circinella umbellata]